MYLYKRTLFCKLARALKRKQVKRLENVVFLDYDGVLNINPYDYTIADKKCIDNLNKLCIKYNLRIVVISSWRKYANYKKMLYEAGLDEKIIIKGRTDDLGENRELEIKTYLSNHKEIDHFVIIDDCNLQELSFYQVKPKYKTGFNDEKYEEAEFLLYKLFKE